MHPPSLPSWVPLHTTIQVTTSDINKLCSILYTILQNTCRQAERWVQLPTNPYEFICTDKRDNITVILYETRIYSSDYDDNYIFAFFRSSGGFVEFINNIYIVCIRELYVSDIVMRRYIDDSIITMDQKLYKFPFPDDRISDLRNSHLTNSLHSPAGIETKKDYNPFYPIYWDQLSLDPSTFYHTPWLNARIETSMTERMTAISVPLQLLIVAPSSENTK